MPRNQTTDVLTAPWPTTARWTPGGVLEIGGVAIPELVRRYGSPLYVYDETTLREAARGFRDAFTAAYPRSRVVYAGKAFLTTALVPILHEEGLGLDVVSGGELFVGLRGGMPPAEISLHGNNKSPRELGEAIAANIGKIVIDNEYEISGLDEMTRDRVEPFPVMIRLNPGVDVHTHKKISTGTADSKFGFPIADGQAASAVARILHAPGLRLTGFHAHVGSQLFDAGATLAAIEALLDFAVEMRGRHGYVPEHLSPGGGFGIAYTGADEPPDRAFWAESIGSAVRDGCADRNLPLPIVTIEPGRAIVGPAGVAVYTVGSTKEIPGVRTYVSVDGGMADNIRPALYDATYTATLASRRGEAPEKMVTIAGKYCESGDILIENVLLPPLQPGDLIAIPAAGAYTLAMAGNYNAAPRPAVVLVNAGDARVIRRRETFDDLVRCDIPAR
ncbi:MAG: diaminopimelate decarboxylase [Chloroflexia bacterium]|nr:diaminopimelate decarboxylase [Chloroflexia bacterium]